MPIHDIRAFSLFEIGKDAAHRPFYVYRLDKTVAAGTPVNQIIDSAKALARSQEAAAARQTLSHAPPRNPRRPQRDLDIKEGPGAEARLYAFYLNVEEGGQPRLIFADPTKPFILFPLNSSSGEDPIEVQGHGADNQFATFIGELGSLRGSPLAGRIRGSAHSDELRIPFYFNVSDPHQHIGAAPWVHSDHSHPHPPGPTGSRTHGGVHPEPVALLTVDL